MALVKFGFNVLKNKIVPTLSKVHGTRRPEFDSEEMVKTMLLRPVAAK